MNYAAVITSQYLAALEMIEQTIERCPDAIWNDSDDKTKFWHIAYHALFYTHLYLADSEAHFTPWPQHRKEYQFIGRTPCRPMRRRRSASHTTGKACSNTWPSVSVTSSSASRSWI